jgi:tetratricopeptide (TPR) repeat protein
MTHYRTPLRSTVGPGLLAWSVLAALCLFGCSRTEAPRQPTVLYVGERPPCMIHPEIMPDVASEKFQSFRQHEADVYQQIDALTAGGDAAQAMGMCNKLLLEQESYLGKDNCESVGTYRRIADCAGRLNDAKTVLYALQRVLEVKARFLGPDCLDTAFALNLVSQYLANSGRAPEALALVKNYRLQAIRHHPSVACQIGYFYVEALALEAQGRFSDASKDIEQALALKATIPALTMVAPKPFALLLVAARAAREGEQLDKAYDYLVQAEHLRFGISQMEDSMFINELLLIATSCNRNRDREGAEKNLQLAVKLACSNRSLDPSFLRKSFSALHYQLMADGKAAEARALDSSLSSMLRAGKN